MARQVLWFVWYSKAVATAHVAVDMLCPMVLAGCMCMRVLRSHRMGVQVCCIVFSVTGGRRDSRT
jgi:hypothetical protein